VPVAETSAFLDNAPRTPCRDLRYGRPGGSLAPDGVARETQRFRMTLEVGDRERAVEIEGLDACRDMFGIEAAAGPPPPPRSAAAEPATGAPRTGGDTRIITART
jgi:hypothetical protein